jgi:endogenous inhibitor of DNA gyrase (YacG/DUF329 family)
VLQAKKRSGPSRPVVVAAVAVVAAAVGVALARLRRTSRGGGQGAGEGGRPQGAEELTSSCPECGQEFRYTGEGRHRVYWLVDAGADDPVLEGRCPRCGHPLPGEQVDEAA